ncbi:YuzB family protein [Clostridium sp. MSJ-4]|uniref:YuzB family protein n=1 Tax=Clostridium simiarum TaxID=2841506 RepID=A0ABS6F0K1_9CLOT|nr:MULTISPECIES: DUF1450 domain-containing protein [Clostridium]MBU5592005.1 YuzB family protein [Clostridium simiarum]
MIRLCAFSKYADDIISLLEKENLEFTLEECLLRCDLCRSIPFVRVGNEFITSDTIEGLIHKLK